MLRRIATLIDCVEIGPDGVLCLCEMSNHRVRKVLL
jgi:hypothetical protein